MEDGVNRIGVSLPGNLLDQFDKIITSRGYSSRSEAIRDAIRNYITEYRWLDEEGGEIVGVINVMYNHHQKGTSDAIVSLQHDFGNVIASTMHMHLSDENCLEMVIVRGEMDGIKKLVNRITTIKGVNNVKLITAAKEQRL
ncbi:MAG: nickel-responsive transcriptional regulator NikR [Archaeoglobaceae archaeon]